MKLPEIDVAQVRIALTQVFDGFVHPVTLVFIRGLKHAAAIDVAE